MTNFGFLILFGLICVLFSCEGQVSPPSNQNITFLPGSTARLKWTFGGDPNVASLGWFFTRRGSSNEEELATKFRTMPATINNSSLPGVAVELPTTLVLKNVDQRYNGKYRFSVQAAGGGDAEVDVFIAVTPTVTLSCSSPITINEGDVFICICRGEGGNPPADVTWYKDGIQIGGTGKEEQTLTFRNADGTDSGTYKCVSQSHIKSTNETSIEIIVKLNSKPNNTTLTPNTAVVGTSVLITCDSAGLPEPSYTISRNGIVVSRNKTYTISPVMESDAGTCTYICIALNKLGNDSACSNLTVEPRPPARPPTTKPSAKPSAKPPSSSTSKMSTTTNPAANTAANKEDDGTTVAVWHIVVSLVSGFILGILFSYIVWCSHRRWFRNRNPEPKTTEDDTTYQELDLTKMNTEDNYQSLRVNAARNDAAANDDNSTYTELSKTRDVEDNYQSLT